MRLLRYISADEYRLTEDLVEDDVPPYAILSHTWVDGQEVTFQEMEAGKGQDKSGYEKIKFCGQQAQRDGLEYFWVDTCCINKLNYGELKDAINSMYHWYKSSAKCYVFLTDVSTAKRKACDEAAESSWELAFSSSRWFSRGWTLQELLAPSSVEFFTQQYKRLGDREALIQKIQRITGISKSALQGAPLSQFSTNEKLSWIENRQTTKEEDRAYSLLGIFGVYMPPMYGEGTATAFRRLMDEIDLLAKCRRDVRLSDPRDDKKRIESTKGGLLEESYCWILENTNFLHWRNGEQSRLLWLKGDPGKGKTMLLCGIINELRKIEGRGSNTRDPKSKNSLISFFFCQATDARLNNATSVLRGLIYLLIDQQPSISTHLRKKYDQAGRAAFEDTNAWIVLSDIFTDMLHDPALKSTYLIVDALDECMRDLPKLLDLIISTSKSTPPGRIKWLLSSRNEAHIDQKLGCIDVEARLSLELKQNAQQVSDAVNLYIDRKLSCVESLDDENLRAQVRDILRQKANGTFLWVALVVQELQSPECWDPLQAVEEAPTGLYRMFDSMMHQIQALNERNSKICRLLLSIASVAYRPLYLAEMGSLCGLSGHLSTLLQNVKKIVKLCGSFVTVRDDQIYLIHQSAKDYLCDEEQAKTLLQDSIHHRIFSQSLRIMFNTLKRDMYNLGAQGWGCLVEEVKEPNPDPLAAVRYSCIYWIDHLYESGTTSSSDIEDGGAVEMFLRQKYLYWLETLSLCRSMSNGVISMGKLCEIIQERMNAVKLRDLAQDAYRFIMSHKVAMETSPLQTYASALLFSPSNSLIRIIFNEEQPKWLKTTTARNDNWSACLQTLEVVNGSVDSIVISYDSTLLASASIFGYGPIITIWDVRSGLCLHTFDAAQVAIGHKVTMSFKPNGVLLLASPHDSVVLIHDVRTGECLQKMTGHTARVYYLAFSNSTEQLLSASKDKTIKVWSTGRGECFYTIERVDSILRHVAFSYDSTQFALVFCDESSSNDGSFTFRRTESGECIQTLPFPSGLFPGSHVFSHDLTRSAWVGGYNDVYIWEIGGENCPQALKGRTSSDSALAFSHDSKKLASASSDNTVRIWDVQTGKCWRILTGHTNSVTSMAFLNHSTRLASTSFDRTVKIWDISSDERTETFDNHHSKQVTSIAFSSDSTNLATAFLNGDIGVWDVRSGHELVPLKGHCHEVIHVAFSHDSMLLASASSDHMVKIWSMNGKGECVRTLKGHSDAINLVLFSHDSTLLASGSRDRTIKIWDTSSGEQLTVITFDDLPRNERYAAFSHDATKLASIGWDDSLKIWDAQSGKCLNTFACDDKSFGFMTFSIDSTRLAIASAMITSPSEQAIRIRDAQSGECLQTIYSLRSRRPYIRRLSIDPSGLCLHTNIGTMDISASPDPSTGNTEETQLVQYHGISLSEDNQWIMYNNRRLLWLPSEHRPKMCDVSGKKMAIVTGSGNAWIFNFEDQE